MVAYYLTLFYQFFPLAKKQIIHYKTNINIFCKDKLTNRNNV